MRLFARNSVPRYQNSFGSAIEADAVVSTSAVLSQPTPHYHNSLTMNSKLALFLQPITHSADPEGLVAMSVLAILVILSKV